MLVLSRRIGETVVVNGVVQITVLEIKGGKIRLGITAPAATPIDRQEVYERRLQFMEPQPDLIVKSHSSRRDDCGAGL